MNVMIAFTITRMTCRGPCRWGQVCQEIGASGMSYGEDGRFL